MACQQLRLQWALPHLRPVHALPQASRPSILGLRPQRHRSVPPQVFHRRLEHARRQECLWWISLPRPVRLSEQASRPELQLQARRQKPIPAQQQVQAPTSEPQIPTANHQPRPPPAGAHAREYPGWKASFSPSPVPALERITKRTRPGARQVTMRIDSAMSVRSDRILAINIEAVHRLCGRTP